MCKNLTTFSVILLIDCRIADEIKECVGLKRTVPSFGQKEMQRHLTDGLTLPSERSMVWFQIELRQEKIIISKNER